jgi:hypothetical protein
MSIQFSDEEVARRVAEAEHLLDLAEQPHCTPEDRRVFLHQVWATLDGIHSRLLLSHGQTLERRAHLTMLVSLERDQRLEAVARRVLLPSLLRQPENQPGNLKAVDRCE